MKHTLCSAASTRLRTIGLICGLLIAGLTTEASAELYLRAIGGSWNTRVSPNYQMTKVKDEEGLEVYNWTGFFPSSFIIADEDYNICLGSPSALEITGPLMQPAPLPVYLSECEQGNDEMLLKTSGKTDRNAEDMLIVEKRNGEWMAMIVNPAYLLCVDEMTDEITQTDMWGSFDNNELMYECVCDLTGSFKVLRGNGGTMYNRTSPSIFVEKDKVYDIDVNDYKPNQLICPDSEEGFKNVLIQIRYNMNTYKSTFLMTDYVEKPTDVKATFSTPAVEAWYTLQGERLTAPRPGVLIHVTTEGATKVLYR